MLTEKARPRFEENAWGRSSHTEEIRGRKKKRRLIKIWRAGRVYILCVMWECSREEMDSCVIYLHIHFTFWSRPLARRHCSIGRFPFPLVPSGYLLLLQRGHPGLFKRRSGAGFIVIEMHEMWNNAQWAGNESACTAQMLLPDGLLLFPSAGFCRAGWGTTIHIITFFFFLLLLLLEYCVSSSVQNTHQYSGRSPASWLLLNSKLNFLNMQEEASNNATIFNGMQHCFAAFATSPFSSFFCEV